MKALTSTGITFSAQRFEGTQKYPYLTYHLKLTNTDAADDGPWLRRVRYDVQLYSSLMDLTSTKKVMAALDGAGIPYDLFGYDDQAEKSTYVVFETTVLGD